MHLKSYLVLGDARQRLSNFGLQIAEAGEVASFVGKQPIPFFADGGHQRFERLDKSDQTVFLQAVRNRIQIDA